VGRSVATVLGDKFHFQALENLVGEEFLRNLQAVEAIHEIAGSDKKFLEDLVAHLLARSETDLGVVWESGKFKPTGAKLLDDSLINESLKWLRSRTYETVIEPFEKALRHFLSVTKEPDRASDVVTDMYEALEAMAKKVTGQDRDLSGNQELFLSKIKASDGYKRIFREYISYANTIRHAARGDAAKPKIDAREAESFMYLTGLFIRLAAATE
jgi:hypothetical protein